MHRYTSKPPKTASSVLAKKSGAVLKIKRSMREALDARCKQAPRRLSKKRATNARLRRQPQAPKHGAMAQDLPAGPQLPNLLAAPAQDFEKRRAATSFEASPETASRASPNDEAPRTRPDICGRPVHEQHAVMVMWLRACGIEVEDDAATIKRVWYAERRRQNKSSAHEGESMKRANRAAMLSHFLQVSLGWLAEIPASMPFLHSPDSWAKTTLVRNESHMLAHCMHKFSCTVQLWYSVLCLHRTCVCTQQVSWVAGYAPARESHHF